MTGMPHTLPPPHSAGVVAASAAAASLAAADPSTMGRLVAGMTSPTALSFWAAAVFSLGFRTAMTKLEGLFYKYEFSHQDNN